MSSRLRRWVGDPLVLLCLAAGLLAFVVQSGELGTADTMHRLQVTHWLWTSEPQVFPNDSRPFNGKSFTTLRFTTWPVVASWVCNSTLLACTSMVCEAAPTTREKLTSRFRLTVITTPSLRWRSKPDASADT